MEVEEQQTKTLMKSLSTKDAWFFDPKVFVPSVCWSSLLVLLHTTEPSSLQAVSNSFLCKIGPPESLSDALHEGVENKDNPVRSKGLVVHWRCADNDSLAPFLIASIVGVVWEGHSAVLQWYNSLIMHSRQRKKMHRMGQSDGWLKAQR